MDINKAAELTAKYEGFSSTPYRCPSGKLTIGYGLNLERTEPLPESAYTYLGKYFLHGTWSPNDKFGGLQVTKGLAQEFLHEDLWHFWRQMAEELPFIPELPESVQHVVLDMAYNMGMEGLKTFRYMLAALKAGNWLSASMEMLDSRWAGQVNTRADDHARTLRSLRPEDRSIEQRLEWLKLKVDELCLETTKKTT